MVYRHTTARQCNAEMGHQERHEGSSAQRGGSVQNGIAASLWPLLLGCGPAFADAEAKYNPTKGSDSVKSIAGVFYAGLLAVFAYRLLTRRAKKFREEVRCLTIDPLICLAEGRDTDLAALVSCVLRMGALRMPHEASYRHCPALEASFKAEHWMLSPSG